MVVVSVDGNVWTSVRFRPVFRVNETGPAHMLPRPPGLFATRKDQPRGRQSRQADKLSRQPKHKPFRRAHTCDTDSQSYFT
jgi:hypothetical protein